MMIDLSADCEAKNLPTGSQDMPFTKLWCPSNVFKSAVEEEKKKRNQKKKRIF